MDPHASHPEPMAQASTPRTSSRWRSPFSPTRRRKKKALHAEINKRFVETLGISPDDLFVMFVEIGPASNISFGRGIAQLAK